MKLAIVGSRGIDIEIDRFVKSIEGVDLIISGGAKGIDTMAERYAKKNKIPVRIIRPDYNSLGRSAPLTRDRQMVDEADMILAIWDGVSRGTAYTVNYAHKMNKPVKLFKWVKEATVE